MEPFWFHFVAASMPTTLTLKNIPDAVYERLKIAAATHRRSLNSEAIVCPEAVLLPAKMSPGERLPRARELRAGLRVHCAGLETRYQVSHHGQEAVACFPETGGCT